MVSDTVPPGIEKRVHFAPVEQARARGNGHTHIVQQSSAVPLWHTMVFNPTVFCLKLSSAKRRARRTTFNIRLRPRTIAASELGTLSRLPDELLAEICKHLVPPEVTGMVFEGDSSLFGTNLRENPLDVMRTCSKFCAMLREQKRFRERTYHFAVSGIGYSFEGHHDCPPEVIMAAMLHVEHVQVNVEIDLCRIYYGHYNDKIGSACSVIVDALKCLDKLGKRLASYHVEISVIDSAFDPHDAIGISSPFYAPSSALLYGHQTSVTEVLDDILDRLVRVQNIHEGSAKLTMLPRSRHPSYDCSRYAGNDHLQGSAKAIWSNVYRNVGAAAYLLSGTDEEDLEWCLRCLRIQDWKGYQPRVERVRDMAYRGLPTPPVCDDIMRLRCDCVERCLFCHI